MTKTLNTNLSNLAHFIPGDPDGLATLDNSGKVPLSQLPATILGSMNYQGTWNAATNIPAIQSGVGSKGNYYTVSVSGTTSIDGIDVWYVGDVIVFNGSTWDRLDGSAGEVLSVNGQTGAVVLGTMSNQNSNSVSITGGVINSATVANIGTNSHGTRWISTVAPTTQGVDGDIWLQIV